MPRPAMAKVCCWPIMRVHNNSRGCRYSGAVLIARISRRRSFCCTCWNWPPATGPLLNRRRWRTGMKPVAVVTWIPSRCCCCGLKPCSRGLTLCCCVWMMCITLEMTAAGNYWCACWNCCRSASVWYWPAVTYPARWAVCIYCPGCTGYPPPYRSEEHTSELQSRPHLVCRLLLDKKNYIRINLLEVILCFSMQSFDLDFRDLYIDYLTASCDLLSLLLYVAEKLMDDWAHWCTALV